MNNLDPPLAASTDPNAREIASIWDAQGQQYVSIDPNLWDDPAGWGLMLVDLARHVASAYAQLRGADRIATLERIKAGWDAQWSYPTDIAHGSV